MTPSSRALKRVIVSVTVATDNGCTAPTADAALPALDELDEKRGKEHRAIIRLSRTRRPHSAISVHAGSAPATGPFRRPKSVR